MRRSIIFLFVFLLAACAPAPALMTDQGSYLPGETVHVLFRNGPDAVLYEPFPHFWRLEAVQDPTAWFQLEDAMVGSPCALVLRERPEPRWLEAHACLTDDWEQTVCNFDTGVVEYAPRGEYRLVFTYELDGVTRDMRSRYFKLR